LNRRPSVIVVVGANKYQAGKSLGSADGKREAAIKLKTAKALGLTPSILARGHDVIEWTVSGGPYVEPAAACHRF
jgi:hypothetical protein